MVSKGENALFKYNKIRYSFVELSAGEQQVLTSDPWSSFLASNLQRRLAKSRGQNRIKIERSIYFASLAEEFFRAADSVQLPAKGTLLYYGMLDLVKCYLSLKNVPLETTHEHHGLVLPMGKKHTIEVKGIMQQAVNIFLEFCKVLGKPITSPHEVNFQQALSHVPEIHSIYTTLGHINKRKLLPVDIEFQVNNAKDVLFTEVLYQKEQDAKVETSKFNKKERKKYFRDGYPRDGYHVYRSKQRKSYTASNIHTIYRNILKDYKKLDIVPILTKQGYRYYVDLRPGELSHLAYTLLAMFYLGSAARYRPSEMNVTS